MPQDMTQTEHSLTRYQVKFEQLLKENIPLLGEQNRLRDACEYALLNGGKRFRPFLVHLVAEALQPGAPVSQVALAVEYLHTASLIADDLPCMDDDDERRSKPSLHKAFDESTALLASYALIAAGYGGLAKNSRELSDSAMPYAHRANAICALALENVSANTGLLGATGGQFLDIYPPDLSIQTIKEVLHKKTVTLFEISFVLGWLYAGGDLDRLEEVKKTAAAFGMAFQIADDLGDQEQDEINGRKINMATVAGREMAIKMLHHELAQYRQHLAALGIATPALLSLATALEN